jgi:hypothetical protein
VSCSLAKMFSKTALLAVSVLLIPGISAFASTSSGIDTPSGVTNLPLAVEGLQIMTLTNTNDVGNVGIGTTSPQGFLDVETVYNGMPPLYWGSNTQAYPAANPAIGGAITGNFSGGAAETNFWNLYTGANESFDFNQLTGASSRKELMTLLANGNVGIGKTSPAAALDVSGAMRATGSTTVSGTAYATTIGLPCTPIGAFAYDTSNSQPVYCNSASTWESFITGLPPNSTASWSEPTIGMPCSFTTNAAGVPTATIYENTNNGWKSVGTIAGMPMTQSSYLGGQNGAGGLANVWLYQTVCLATQWGLAVSTYYNSVLYGSGCAPWTGLCSGTQVQGQPDYSTVVPWTAN